MPALLKKKQRGETLKHFANETRAAGRLKVEFEGFFCKLAGAEIWN